MRMWTYWIRNIKTDEVKEIFTDQYHGEPGEMYDDDNVIDDYAEYIHNTFEF